VAHEMKIVRKKPVFVSNGIAATPHVLGSLAAI